MIDVLFIAFEFPPTNSGGSHRPYRFVKHMKKLGVNPVVVTPEVDGAQIDQSLFEGMEDIRVVRTPIQQPTLIDRFLSKQYINVLDPEARRWEKYMYRAVEKLVSEYDFKAMYVTAPPFSVADLGVKISKAFDLPLIVDMRDSWSYWNITPFASYFHYQMILRKERKWFAHAKVVVVTAEQLAEDYTRLHPSVDKRKFHTIRNSYPVPITKVQESIQIRRLTPSNPLKIGYVGSFYYHPYQRKMIFDHWWKKPPYQWFQYAPKKEDWLYRSPYFFFKALSSFSKVNPELTDLIRVEFIGAKPEWLVDMVKEFGLEQVVMLKGFLPHKESLAFQQECDVLLGTSHKVIDGKVYCIAGKSFEYIYMQKPIIAFVKEGAQKKIFEESGLSIICDSDCVEENVGILKSLVTGAIELHPDKKAAEHNYTGYTAEKLAALIFDIADTPV
jgi:hypothetical protein